MSSNSTLMEPWHRIESEAELKALIWAGWTDFTVRPGGTTEWVQCTKELWTAHRRQDCHYLALKRLILSPGRCLET